MLCQTATRIRACLSADVFVVLYILLLYGIVIPSTIQKRGSVNIQRREGYGFRQRTYQHRHIQVHPSVSISEGESCAKIVDCHCGEEMNFQRRIIPHKLAIAGIVRDSLPSLPRMRRYIETIGNLFEDYRVIIIENDSSDGTKEFLNAWSSEAERCGKKVIVDSHQMSSNSKPLQKRPNHEFLARMRNRYLDIVLSIEFANFDMIAVIDLDLKRIDVPGFLKAVNDWVAPNMNMTTRRLRGDEQSNWWRDLAMELSAQKGKSTGVSIPHWAGITANGVTQDGKYFDIFALRVEPSLRWNPGNGCLFRTSRGRELIQKHQIPIEHVSYLDPTSTLPTPLYIPVASAFGGLAIYQMAAVRGCRYRSPHDDCEHVDFHRCVARRWRTTEDSSAITPLAIASQMLVEYDLPCDPGPEANPSQCFNDSKVLAHMRSFQKRKVRSTDPGCELSSFCKRFLNGRVCAS